MRRATVAMLCFAWAGCGDGASKPGGSAPASPTPAAAPTEARAICARAAGSLDGRAALDAAAVRTAVRSTLAELDAVELSEQASVARGHLEAQVPTLERLARLERRRAPESRRAKLAGALDLKRRLASGADPEKSLEECFALAGRISGRYEERAYLRRAIPILRKGREIVAEPGWNQLSSESEDLVARTIRYAFDHIYVDFGSAWDDLTPPEHLRAAHDEVTQAISGMLDVTEAADDKITTEGRPVSEARRILSRFPREQRKFQAVARRFLAAVEDR